MDGDAKKEDIFGNPIIQPDTTIFCIAAIFPNAAEIAREWIKANGFTAADVKIKKRGDTVNVINQVLMVIAEGEEGYHIISKFDPEKGF